MNKTYFSILFFFLFLSGCSFSNGSKNEYSDSSNKNTGVAEITIAKEDNEKYQWHIFEDENNGFAASYPDPLIYVRDAGSGIIFQAQYPYEEDGREAADIIKVSIIKYSNSERKSAKIIAEEAASKQNGDNFYSCKLGGGEAFCFNAKSYYNDIEIKNSYSKIIFFENKENVYAMSFFASGEMKDKSNYIFEQIENRFEFIK